MRRLLGRVLVVIIAIAFVLFWLVVLYGGTLNRTSARVTLSALDVASVPDGVYDGSATILHLAPKVRVTVADGRIMRVAIVTPVYGDLAGLAARVVAAQSLDVDGITGATISTKAVLKAIDNALTVHP